jgi:hypothetical protein
MIVMPGSAKGYRAEFDGNQQVPGTERQTFTCCHCPRIVSIPHKAKPEELGRFCHQCGQMTCMTCAHDPNCRSYMRQVDAFLRRAALLKAAGIGG